MFELVQVVGVAGAACLFTNVDNFVIAAGALLALWVRRLHGDEAPSKTLRALQALQPLILVLVGVFILGDTATDVE